MTEPKSAGKSLSKRVARRIVELLTAAALIIVAVWPTKIGHLWLLVLVVSVFFAGLLLLSKWPSI